MKIARPLPPEEIREEAATGIFLPSTELRDWLHETFIDGTGPLVNYEHEHLKAALIGCLWTNALNQRQMNAVVGTAEMPNTKGGWIGARQEYQIRQWFGAMPDFIITLYAPYAYEAGDLQFCALVEHELYHCAQRMEPWGEPKFDRWGRPVFAIRGHDVEEHVGIMRRYGISGCAGKTRAFVEAAMKAPEIGEAEIEGVCGTCSK